MFSLSELWPEKYRCQFQLVEHTTSLKKIKSKISDQVLENKPKGTNQTRQEFFFFTCKPVKVYNNIPWASSVSPWPKIILFPRSRSPSRSSRIFYSRWWTENFVDGWQKSMGVFYSNKTDVVIFITNLHDFFTYNKNATEIEETSWLLINVTFLLSIKIS